MTITRTLAPSVALLISMVAASAARVATMNRFLASVTYEDVYYVPPASWMPVFALGWDEAVADLVWARALVYFGEEMSNRGAVRHVFDYGEVILELDPDFRAAYDWIAVAGLYRPQDITAEDALRAVEFLRRGRERFPEDGELAWRLGGVLAFEIPPLLADQEARDASRSEATEHLMDAARLGAGPEWLALTNAAILSRVGRAEVAADHLEQMYAMTQDESMRAQIAEGIAALRSSAHAEGLVEATRQEEERRIRELPYLSPSLYFVIGPRPLVPWRRAYREGFVSDMLSDEDDVLRGMVSDDGP